MEDRNNIITTDEQVGPSLQIMVGSSDRPVEGVHMALGRSIGDQFLSVVIALSFLSIAFWAGWFIGYTQPKPDEVIYVSPVSLK